jgi:hypothetical protein
MKFSKAEFHLTCCLQFSAGLYMLVPFINGANFSSWRRKMETVGRDYFNIFYMAGSQIKK